MRVGLCPSAVLKYWKVVRAMARGTDLATGSSRCTEGQLSQCFSIFLKEASLEFCVKASDFEMLASSSPSFLTLSIHTVPANYGQVQPQAPTTCWLPPAPRENLPRERKRMAGAGGFPEAPCVSPLILASVLEGC